MVIRACVEAVRNYRIPLFLGAVLGLAFPPVPLGFIMYIGLFPILKWSQSGTAGLAFKRGYWWGLGYNAAGLFWFMNSTILGGSLALLYLPLFSAVSLLLFRWVYKKYGMLFYVLFPVLWTAIEYFRTLGVLGFSWMSIAHSQTYYPVLLQYADITGVHGVVFWICVLNVLLFLAFHRARSIDIGFTRTAVVHFIKDRQFMLYIVALMICFVVPVMYGVTVMNSGSWYDETVKVSLIQGNIDMAEKTDVQLRDPMFSLYDSLSISAAADNPDLIVWSETAALAFLDFSGHQKYNDWMQNIVSQSRASILTGSYGYERIEKNGEISVKTFNAAVMYDRESLQKTWYGKIRLVPFGEWFPYEDRFPVFQNLDFGQANFTPGESYTLFEVVPGYTKDEPNTKEYANNSNNPILYSVAICYESIFSEFIQKFSSTGAQFLVVITNNNWFGKTSSLYQHAQISVFRAIENRMGVAHCSNSGISIFVDPYGKITDSSSVYVKDTLTSEVYYRDADTIPPLYVRYGEWFSNSFLIVSGIVIVGGLFKKTRDFK